MSTAYPLRLTTLSSGTTHHGRQSYGAYFIRCRSFSVTPSWLPGVDGASGVVVGLDGGAHVTCRRCLRLDDDASESVDLMVRLRASVEAAKKRRLAAAGLSLQEEQPKHLVGAGGWRACDTAADWAGSDTTGVTCAECLATTTDVLQEEQE